MSMGRAIERLDGWWHARFDEQADWEREEIALPSLSPLPLTPREPSMGWRRLEEEMESLRVPGTWEHARPGYRGVAWHWRPLLVPGEWQAERVHVRFEGARWRTEVYLDEALVGYDLDGATPFEVDVTPYVRPDHRHELALRVTHPGGWRDVRQVTPVRWGEHALLPGPDVGGIWGEVSLIGRPAPHIDMLTTYPDAKTPALPVRVSVGCAVAPTPCTLSIAVYGADGALLGQTEQALLLLPSERRRVDLAVTVSTIPQWQPENPRLVTVEARLTSWSGVDTANVMTGMRCVRLADDGLWLHDARCPLRGALTAGFYPLDWILPRGAMADDEARVARQVGLNALVAWHQPLHPDLLAAADRRGLLIVQTTGLGPLVADDAFYADLARERVRRVIARDAHHPSLIAWHLADESASRGGMSPLMAELVERARKDDPTRPIIWGAGRRRLLGVDPQDGREVCLSLGERRLWGGVSPGDRPEGVVCAVVPAILPDVPDVAARYGDRGMPGSDAEAYRRWARTLRDEFDAQGGRRDEPDLSAYCRATWPTQETLRQAWGMGAQGLPTDDAGHCAGEEPPDPAAVLLESWSGAAILDPASLVDPFRRPKVRE